MASIFGVTVDVKDGVDVAKVEKEIDKGSNQYLEWTETLYEDEDYITYEEWGYGEVLKSMPGIDDDIDTDISHDSAQS